MIWVIHKGITGRTIWRGQCSHCQSIIYADDADISLIGAGKEVVLRNGCPACVNPRVLMQAFGADRDPPAECRPADERAGGPVSILYEDDGGGIIKVGPFKSEDEALAEARLCQESGEFDIRYARVYLLRADHSGYELSEDELLPQAGRCR